MNYTISGIQQIGIGVSDVHEAFKWYRHNFGIDIRVFEEAATAGLMLPYTDNQPQERHAILAFNLQGGGGLEIWQYTGRTPQPPAFEPQLGDYGLFVSKIKSRNVVVTYQLFQKRKQHLLGNITTNPAGEAYFFMKDPYGNIFQIIGCDTWFKNEKKLTGGAAGCIIGVSDIEKARMLYSDILGYDEVVYDKEEKFNDFAVLPGGRQKARRVLLRHSEARKGVFSRLVGPTEMELVQVKGKKPRKIYENRLWGDLGYIHLCFDISGMQELKKTCEAKGFPFTVDSSESFDMGEAAGHFSYIEDPDGTLIEFVETHKVPILKKIGWYLNLKNRDPEKPLPNWMVKAMAFNRVKD
ncbi:MAG: glyoxalase [Flavobacteriales bacterium]|nr:VOC family protein [Bacteroidales bacterium AH-315-I05]PCJ88788.1 MAG: glyoxalase [Flavobacteriales bacterium]